MSRAPGAAGAFWGFLLVAAGAIFLARNLGLQLPVWDAVARYWPALLIVWGILKLLDYARTRGTAAAGPLFGAGEIVLLVFVVLGGSALTAAVNMSSDLPGFFGFDGLDFGLSGNEYAYAEHHERDVAADSAIEIINRYGGVEVRPADVDRIVVDVAKTVIAPNQAEADRLAMQLTYSIVEQGGGYRVISSLNRDQNRMRGRRLRTTLTVRVPKKSRLTIDNMYGEVRVADLVGAQRISNGFAGTVVSGITGDLNLRNRNGDVTVSGVDGAATIANEFAGVEVKDITKSLDVRHRNGSLDVSGVKGAVTLSNAFGSINAGDLSDSVVVETRNGSVDLARVGGDVRVKNEFESVRLENVAGAVEVRNRNGSVELRYAEPPKKDIRITSEFGDVSVRLPAMATFSIDAKTRFGSVSSDFPELSRSTDNNQRNSLSGSVGASGPGITIDNRNGSIDIER